MPVAERRAVAAATVDLTATTGIETNSLFDSTDELCEMSRKVQRTRVGKISRIVEMPTSNNDQTVPRRSEL